MWSYVDHWGDWSAPLGRVPAALLDVAHKNGVAVSGTAGIPQSSIAYGDYASWYNGLSTDYGTKAAKMIFYYGSQGFGYNSEFTGNANGQQRVIAFHKQLNKTLLSLGDPNAESIWYDGTNDNGSNTFDSALSGYQGLFGTDAEPVLSVFGNYNSMTATKQSAVITNAASFGRSSLFYYSGLNMQGGDPSTNWSVIKDYATSIGLWGAHSSNMFFQQRYQNGTTPDKQQRTYLLSTERWFGGGHRNPVLHQNAFSNVSYSFSNENNNPGMCSMMSARSTLQWNLSEEPFVTFFNLGNGTFLNYKGVRAHSDEWANVGVQDYLPTWRYWFHTSWLGRTTSGTSTGLDAQFIWDDAYVGGSCLELSGTTSGAYLHLFKTKFALQAGDVITLRYKLEAGSADVDLAFSAEGSESTVITGSEFNVVEGDRHFDQDLWVEKTFTVGDGNTLAGKTIAVIALHFNSANNAKIYLGELSIKRGTATTPAAPTNLTANVLYSGETGIDAKLLWDMPGMNALPTATFNLDVNASLFKMYAQVDDNEPILMGLTTSWAGLIFRVPNTGTKVRFGVSAVSTDFDSESAITWSAEQNVASQTYTYNDDITIDKAVIKPGEEFTLSYVDPGHETGTWTIVNQSGATVASGSGKSFTTSIATSGVYTLRLTGYVHNDGITPTSTTTTYTNYVVISPESTGSVPLIKTLTIDGESENIEINANEDHTVAFTARHSDGSVSQGIRLNSRFFGSKGPDLGLQNCTGTTYAAATQYNSEPYSVTFWIKPTADSGGFYKIVDPVADSWSANNWGGIWSTYSADGSLTMTYRGVGACYLPGSNQTNPEVALDYPAGTLTKDTWQHVALCFDWSSSQYYRYGGTSSNAQTTTGWSVRPRLYINGVRVEPVDLRAGQGGGGTKYSSASRAIMTTTNDNLKCRIYARSHIPADTYIILGGSDRVGGLEADLDHFAIWSKSLSADEVLTSMGDITSNLSGLLGLYTFDNGQDAQGWFLKHYGSYANGKIGLMEATAGTQHEGQYLLAPIETELVAGYPMLQGSATVTTTPTWTINGADIKSQTISNTASVKAADDLTGSAVVTWPTEGVRDVTLTLTNDYGTDSKTITAVNVVDPFTAIDGIIADENRFEVVTSQDAVLVRVPEAGEYVFTLFAADGRKVAQKASFVNAGGSVSLSLPNQGVFILNLKKDGKQLKGIKFVRE